LLPVWRINCVYVCLYVKGRLMIVNEGGVNKTYIVRIKEHRGAFMQPLLQWKINNYYVFWERVYSLRCPACKAHVPYCHLWPARFYRIFPHYLINGTIQKKVIENKMCVFGFCRTFVWNISRPSKNLVRYYHKIVLIFM